MLRAYIDSINLSSPELENVFDDKEHYSIEEVKSIGTFEPHRWREAFEAPLTRNIVEAKILHIDTGLEIPLKTYAVSPKMQTIEFAGLKGYNERSRLLNGTLRELQVRLAERSITRMDVAIDFKCKMPSKINKEICKHRPVIYRDRGTTYFKTEKEGKKNNRLNIKYYDKAAKEGFSYPLYRLEFVFQGSYFSKPQFQELETLFPKMENTIKIFTGLEVKIQSL